MNKSLTQRFLLLALTLSLIGCLPGTKSSSRTTLAPTVNEPKSLEFMGSDYFDNALSGAMNDNYTQIAVSVTQPFSINNIPERMNAWLGVIGGSGGEVKTEPVEGSRNMLGLVAALYPLYQELMRQLSYLPAKNYNATLFYRNEEGEAMIEQVVFTRR